MYPELYIGVMIGRNKYPGKCICHGTIICDGPRSRITIDRNGLFVIEKGGKVCIQNDAILRSTNNNGICLQVNGTLILDDIEQMKSFRSDNISFGKDGKIITSCGAAASFEFAYTIAEALGTDTSALREGMQYNKLLKK